jgi:DNA invertase Pin-like site-specific DNA recombinase
MLIGYARVSTEEQTLDMQHDALIRAGVLPDDIYTDKLSGAKAKRPGLDLAMKRLRAGDTLIIWKLDRLGRDLEHLLKIAREIQEEIGASFKSLTEQIEFNTGPMGKLMFQLLGMLAEFERNITRERTRAGMDSAAARGRKGGRRHYVSPDQLVEMKIAILAGELPKDVAPHFGIKPRTLFNYIKGGREKLLERIAAGVEPDPRVQV